MPLKENELFGQRDKVSIAIERIRQFEPMALQNNPLGYYVCISGGKDSSVIQELCIMAGVKCEFVHNHTGIDYPETVYFIRNEKKRIEALGYSFRIELPRFENGKQKTILNLIPKKGLPTRLHRWCCKELKESGGISRYCITGVRWAESVKRRKRGLHEEVGKKLSEGIFLNNDNDMRRRLTEICLSKKTLILNPIIDWTEYDVWDFIKSRNLAFNPLYTRGLKRVGCIGCPMSVNAKQELNKLPKYKAAYFKAAQKYLEYRKERGLSCHLIMETPEIYFNWWLSGKGSHEYETGFLNEGDF